MIGLFVLLLLPLHFTVPANAPAMHSAGGAPPSAAPVRAYEFYRLDRGGALAPIPGYADSTGRTLFVPHAPGGAETVWLEADGRSVATTVYVVAAPGRPGTRGSGSILGIQSRSKPAAPRRAEPNSRAVSRDEFLRRWEAAGSQVLVARQGQP